MGEPDERRVVFFRVVLGASTLLMLGLSWPLWIGTGTFPRVPFVLWLPVPIEPLRWARFAALLASIGLGVRWPRVWLASIALLALAILEDQHRFQPWAYQFAMCSFAVACLPSRFALLGARIVLIALYVHSGLSKLDASFARELGPLFLSRLVGPFGVDVADWPAGLRGVASLSLPLFELAAGVGLIFARTRRWALIAILGLHASLIAILGPWPGGLDHSTIVLVWNGSLAIQAVLLFSAWGAGIVDVKAAWPRKDVAMPPGDRGAVVLVALIVTVALVLPFGERSGFWDAWPSFALYASHGERVLIDVHEAEAWPEAVGRHVATSPADGLGSPWRRLDATAWSRSERGTPPYPSARAAMGVAEALAATGRAVRVTTYTRADRLSGHRSRQQVIGLDAIRRLGDDSRLNAHPAVSP